MTVVHGAGRECCSIFELPAVVGIRTSVMQAGVPDGERPAVGRRPRASDLAAVAVGRSRSGGFWAAGSPRASVIDRRALRGTNARGQHALDRCYQLLRHTGCMCAPLFQGRPRLCVRAGAAAASAGARRPQLASCCRSGDASGPCHCPAAIPMSTDCSSASVGAARRPGGSAGGYISAFTDCSTHVF